MKAIDRHLRYRSLISDRLAGDIEPGLERRLDQHLAECPNCRMVERAYVREAGRLRALTPRIPPRDLWARTAAALDRELARSRPGRRPRHHDGLTPRTSPALMLTAMGSFAAAIAVVGTQASPVIQAPDDGVVTGPQVAMATPYDVPTQDLAFIEFAGGNLAIYEATVDQACPATADDCAVISAARRSAVSVPGERRVDGLDLGQDGHLAVTTEDERGNNTVSVVFLPMDRPPQDRPRATAGPPQASGTPDRQPNGEAPATDGSAPPTATPANPRRSEDPPRGEFVSLEPITPPPSTSAPSREPAPRRSVEVTRIPTASPALEAVTAVLEDVRVVGARPAWSPDGDMLAFSAMPADRSRGPDVYIWRPGDREPKRLTDDHRSYFASWSKRHLVVSRAVLQTGHDGRQTVSSVTSVIDPSTGAERRVDLDDAWLPSIDPTGRHAIVWRGSLASAGRTVAAQTGELFVIDWRAVDPFDERTERLGQLPAEDRPAEGRDAEPSDDRADERPPRDGTFVPARPIDGGDRPDRTARPSSERTPAPADAHARAEPLEPDRDPRLDPIRDWRIGWSDDGKAFGYWVTETPGETWGTLAVLLIGDRGIDREGVILDGVLARRAFSLGRARVAWIAPSDEEADGELRLRTWGSRGYGSMRIRDIDVSSGMPAF